MNMPSPFLAVTCDYLLLKQILANVISLQYNLDQQNAGADPKLLPDETKRSMDLQQLTDLHNKLMLIIGGDEDIKNQVDQFGEAS